MATYIVRCDNCNVEHERNSFQIIDVVDNCKRCGDDLCPDCDRVGDTHSDCDAQRLEEERTENE